MDNKDIQKLKNLQKLAKTLAAPPAKGKPADFGELKTGLEAFAASWSQAPAGEILGGYSELSRDLGLAAGKDFDFELSGGESLFPREILQELVGPLSHLIRNALVHGLESPEERKETGKEPHRGKITLTFVRDDVSRQFRVKLGDNGRGINAAAVISGSGQGGAGQDEDRADGDFAGTDDLLGLLRSKSYSSAPQPGLLAGRGLGLDLVCRAVEDAGGQILMETEEGVGTSFEITFPQKEEKTMDLLFFRWAGGIFAAFLQRIDRVIPGVPVTTGASLPLVEGEPLYTPRGRLLVFPSFSQGTKFLHFCAGPVPEGAGFLTAEEILGEAVLPRSFLPESGGGAWIYMLCTDSPGGGDTPGGILFSLPG